MFSQRIIDDIIKHARSVYPDECCGVVTGSAYIPMENIHEDKRNAFRMDPVKYGSLLASGRVRAVLHSHTVEHPEDNFPTRKDMEEQAAAGVPWGIVHLGANGKVDGPFWWGDQLEPAPLLGREFRHGVHDCYALQRDQFRDELKITLPDFPRDPEWWDNGQDIILENYEKAGFIEVPVRSAKKYDVGLFSIRGNGLINHVGVYQGDGIMYHHLIGRLSRPDPIEPWLKHLVKLVRHESQFT